MRGCDLVRGRLGGDLVRGGWTKESACDWTTGIGSLAAVHAVLTYQAGRS